MTTKTVPIIAAKSPAKVDLDDGKSYFWCACGKSKTQPFCDGSHAGTDITPIKFTADKSGAAVLCQCKATANQPFCDGSHAKLGDLAVGDPAPAAKSDVPTATPTPEEPTVARIHELARDGLSKLGHHGEMGSMGVPRKDLPHWNDIQILPAQMARKPLLDDIDVGTSVTIGQRAAKPMQLNIPLFVSDMSFGALSMEAKTALARGAELAGTGICSGEGGMLAEEHAENRRYFYELASAKFGWDISKVDNVQAFHFKGGQGAKTGTGGHLPGDKVDVKIAEVRGLNVGEAAISPATFPDLHTPADFKKIADQVRERTG
ncbi:MAG: glutamate synthase-related protein, partial [Pseudomonadota bacterium]